MSSVVNALFTPRHAETGDRSCRHKKTSWVLGATAALLLIGTIAPVGASNTITASDQSTAGTTVTTTTPPVGGGTVDGGSGDVVVGTHGGPTGHVILVGCVGGLNC